MTKNKKIEIRLDEDFKNMIIEFCEQKDIKVSFFLRELAKDFFRKRKIKTRKNAVTRLQQTWDDIEDMPLHYED